METKFKKVNTVIAVMDSPDGFFLKGESGFFVGYSERGHPIISWERGEQTTARHWEVKPIEFQPDEQRNMRYEISKSIYGEIINETTPSIKGVCALIGVPETEYAAETHFPIYCAKRTLVFADALIQALNEKP